SLAYVDSLVVHHHPSPHRDSAARRRLLARNALWTAWLRRPWSRALAQTAALARRALRDAEARVALAQALRGLPWALRHRRVVSPEIEHGLRLIEAAERG
ncbi:MAG TPA: glycosyltransferase family 2 protein, partial [Dehalococcoidia bacterium]